MVFDCLAGKRRVSSLRKIAVLGSEYWDSLQADAKIPPRVERERALRRVDHNFIPRYQHRLQSGRSADPNPAVTVLRFVN